MSNIVRVSKIEISLNYVLVIAFLKWIGNWNSYLIELFIDDSQNRAVDRSAIIRSLWKITWVTFGRKQVGKYLPTASG